jgi:hypothetical protein
MEVLEMNFRTLIQKNGQITKLIDTKKGILLGVILVFSASGCMKQTYKAAPQSHTVFLNSFETPKDTLSWYWSGKYRLTTDTPPGGGSFALEIKGRKALPAGTFISRPLRHGGYFTVECWGKMKNAGGFVQLATISEHEVAETIRIPIFEPEWQFLQSTDTLYCPPNRSLMLSIQAGLDNEGEMVLDLLQVKKVGKAAQPSRQKERNIARRDGL